MRKIIILVLLICNLVLVGCESLAPLYTRREKEFDNSTLTFTETSSFYMCVPTDEEETSYIGDIASSSNIKLEETELSSIQARIDQLIDSLYNWNYMHMDSVGIDKALPIMDSALATSLPTNDYLKFVENQVERYHLVYRISEAYIMPGNYIQSYKTRNEEKILRAYALLNLNVEGTETFFEENRYLSKGSTMLALWIYFVPDDSNGYAIKFWIENYIAQNGSNKVKIG